MSNLRTAAQRALEAWDGGDVKWFANGYRVMDALRAALEQPEQGPCPTCVALDRTVMMDQMGTA